MRKDLILPVIILCIALYGVYFGLTETLKLPQSQFPELHTNFTLQSKDGPVKMSDFNGRVSIVFFGYTHCPDVCPTTLSNISATLNEFNDDEIQAISPIFISLDPERDNPEKAAVYAEHFDPRFIALTGTEEQVETAKKAFAVGSMKQTKDEDNPNINEKNFLISHSTYIFIVRPDGKVGNIMGHLDSPSMIATKARNWLRWAD